MRVTILMATFNGAVHLSRQIESIRSQTFINWELWIRDDGSSDNTLGIIDEIVNIDGRIKLISDEDVGGGAAGNFGLLMRHAQRESNADLFAFSDQDDVWSKDKLSIYVKKYTEKIADFGENNPCLLCSDLIVADNNLTVIKSSFWKMEKVDVLVDLSLASVLNRNVVPGCTMMINRALLIVSSPVPDKAIMHDWWVLLSAVVFGSVVVISPALMFYVQHGNNQLGANNRTFFMSVLKILTSPLITIMKIKHLHRCVISQTETLLKLEISTADRLQIENFLRVRKSGFVTRLASKNMFPSSSLIVKTANILIGI